MDASTVTIGYSQVIELETSDWVACEPFPVAEKKTGLDFGAADDEVFVPLRLRYAWRRKDAATVPAWSTVYLLASDRDTPWARKVKFMPGDEKKQCPVILVPPAAIVIAPQVTPPVWQWSPNLVETNPGNLPVYRGDPNGTAIPPYAPPWDITCGGMGSR